MVLLDKNFASLEAEGSSKPVNGAAVVAPEVPSLLSSFIQSHKDVIRHRCVNLHRVRVRANGIRGNHAVSVDGHTLTTAAIVAAARFAAPVRLDESKRVKEGVEKARQVVQNKVDSGASVYGLSTGFGGSGKYSRSLAESFLILLQLIHVPTNLSLSAMLSSSTSTSACCPRIPILQRVSLSTTLPTPRPCPKHGLGKTIVTHPSAHF